MKREQARQLMGAFEVATTMFAHALKSGAGYDYVRHRGVSDRTIREMRIGFVPIAPMLEEQATFTPALLDSEWMYGRREDSTINQGRICLPMLDDENRVVGAVFRSLPILEFRHQNVRYRDMMLPAAVFQAMGIPSYRMYRVGDVRADEMWLVEGPFDAFRLYEGGVPLVVAGLGLITMRPSASASQSWQPGFERPPDWLRWCDRRGIRRVMLAFDFESKGAVPQLQIAAMLQHRGYTVRVAKPPSGGAKDPGALLDDKELAAFVQQPGFTLAEYVDWLMKRHFDQDDRMQREVGRQWAKQWMRAL